MSTVIHTDKNQMETITYKSLNFPLFCSHNRVSEFLDGGYCAHWHKEMEFHIVSEGAMQCKVGDREYALTQGEGLFINSNVVHTGWCREGEDCSYAVVIMDGSVFGGDKVGLAQQYIRPVQRSVGFQSLLIQEDGGWQSALLRCLREVDIAYHSPYDCYELDIVSSLMRAWGMFYRHVQDRIADGQNGAPDPRSQKIKEMLGYIHEHFSERLTLDELAAAAGISKSSCSHLFKSYMKEPPFDYLLRYRIERSLELLADVDGNVTETALSVGFSSGSYYTEVFKRFMRMTPLEYRKKVLAS